MRDVATRGVQVGQGGVGRNHGMGQPQCARLGAGPGPGTTHRWGQHVLCQALRDDTQFVLRNAHHAPRHKTTQTLSFQRSIVTVILSDSLG